MWRQIFPGHAEKFAPGPANSGDPSRLVMGAMARIHVLAGPFAVPDASSVVSVWSLASGMCVALTVKDLQC